MKTLQNFFKTTISTNWATGTGNRYITTLPSPSSGWLVVSPNNSSLREIVRYTAKGTDINGNYITIAERGVGGTTDQVHTVNEPIRMNITAEYWADIYVDPTFTGTVTVPTPTNSTDATTKAYVDGIAIAGSPDASDTVKGISKLSSAPASATDPIAVGTNDTRMPTQDENDALAGTSGTPSTSNKYVTNDDTATAATANKVARRLASGDITVPTTPTNSTDAGSKEYIDTSISTATGSLGTLFPNTNYVNSTYFTKEVILPASNSLGWAVTSGTGRGGIGVNIAGGGSIISNTLYTLTANTKNIVLDLVAILNQQSITQIGGFGIFDIARSNDTTTQRIAITNNATDGFEFTTCDGSARTSTTITGVTASNMNKYTIVKNGVTSVLLYVNGVLKANHTTNLPTSTAIVLKGSTVAVGIELLNPILSVEI